MRIRSFHPADADALSTLFHASVHGVATSDYTAEQIAAWSPEPPDPARYVRDATDRLILVAEDGTGKPIGYATLEPDGHIDHLYCHPDYICHGVGSALHAAIETTARKAGMSRLFVEASEPARRLFERRGFTLHERNDFIWKGTAIHNYRMSKSLCS